MEIIVTDFGVSLGKKSERVVVKRNGSVVEEHPLFEVSHIIVGSNGVSVSSDLVRECAAAGVPISFVSGSGKPLARLSSPEMVGSVETRRQQMMAFNDGRGVRFALAIARAKIANQAVILKYFGKSRKTAQPSAYERLREAVRRIERTVAELDALDGGREAGGGESGSRPDGTLDGKFDGKPDGETGEVTAEECIDDLRLAILSVEGRAGRIYWEAMREILPAELGFTGREHQGARDLTNSLLNYGYGILYSQVWGAATLAGLDPFAGFLHVDRPGKPSLVLDLVEEFRQMVVDRTVFGLLTKGVTYKQTEEGMLADEARREFARRILDRLDAPVRYEGKRERLRAVIQRQARHLACFFRNERDYAGFVGTW
jgi:CRISPR-associated protein Cas1